MFTIIGGDGKEYGPVTVEQMKQWLAAGRANLETQAKRAGEEQWRRVGDFPEFTADGDVPPLIAEDSALAGRGVRTGAALINAAIYLLGIIPGAVIMTARALAIGARTVADMDPATLSSASNSMLVGVIVAVAVQAGLLAARGQNLGMLMTGIRVVRFSDGQPAGFLHGALLRFLVPVSLFFFPGWVSFLGMLLLCVDYCFIFRSDRRCLHDLIADTKVVKK